MDVCGPMSIHAKGGFICFITFVNDYSLFKYLYPMRYNYKSFEKFRDFINEAEKQISRSIKSIK